MEVADSSSLNTMCFDASNCDALFYIVTVDGPPEFKHISTQKKYKVADYALQAICPLPRYIFVGGSADVIATPKSCPLPNSTEYQFDERMLQILELGGSAVTVRFSHVQPENETQTRELMRVLLETLATAQLIADTDGLARYFPMGNGIFAPMASGRIAEDKLSCYRVLSCFSLHARLNTVNNLVITVEDVVVPTFKPISVKRLLQKRYGADWRDFDVYSESINKLLSTLMCTAFDRHQKRIVNVRLSNVFYVQEHENGPMEAYGQGYDIENGNLMAFDIENLELKPFQRVDHMGSLPQVVLSDEEHAKYRAEHVSALDFSNNALFRAFGFTAMNRSL